MGDTTWSHQNKEWQKTLNLARLFGWDPPRVLNDHGGLLLKCPTGDVRHQIRIFSTGRGTESKAIDFRKKINNCPHRDLSEPLARIEGALTGAGRLLDAIDAHLLLVESEGRMADLLDDLELAEEQLAVVQEEFDSAAADAERASEQIEEELRQRKPDDLASDAASALRQAELGLRDDVPTAHEDWQRLHQRHSELKNRLLEVRTRISGP